MSIYSDFVDRFAPDGLTSQQQAELDAIRLASQLDDNDPLWVVVMPIFFMNTRKEQAKLDQESILRAIGSAQEKLERIERMIVGVDDAIESRVVKIDASDVQTALRSAVAEPLVSWQVATACIASIILAFAAYAWGEKQTEQRYTPVIQQLQQQLQHLQTQPTGAARRAEHRRP